MKTPLDSQDEEIIAFLSNGSKRFARIEENLVGKKMAKQTLVNHLNKLTQTNILIKTRLENGVTYSLNPDYRENATEYKKILTIETMMRTLKDFIDKEIPLKEVSFESAKTAKFNRWIRETTDLKNKPKMNFIMKLDEESKKRIDPLKSSSEWSAKLEQILYQHLYDMKKSALGSIENEFDLLTEKPSDFNDIIDFSSKLSSMHSVRFLAIAWHDGYEYKQKVRSAIKKLTALQKAHEEDIIFLNEVNKRCFYAIGHFDYDPLIIWEEVLPEEVFKQSNPFKMLEDIFCLYFTKEKELMALEVALISERASEKLSETVFDKKLRTFGTEKISAPYKIPNFKKYVSTKLSMLTEDQKRFILADELGKFKEFFDKEGFLHPPFYSSRFEEGQTNIESLIQRIGAPVQKPKSPILNFKLFGVDFSDDPFVKDFMTYLKDVNKRKWLNQCLALGLPIFPSIPFSCLGFKVENIL